MRRYDDPVEVRRGWVRGQEAPEQFLWRGRLWKVREVVAHWVETAPWWQSPRVRAVLGADGPDVDEGEEGGETAAAAAAAAGSRPLAELLVEREVWRVEAGRGAVSRPADGAGVFDLCYDGADGRWQLVGCVD